MKKTPQLLIKAAMCVTILLDYSEKYGYASVFVVSAKSGTYYNQNGVNKVVSPADAHDVWYYDFMESGKQYDLDVDMDEANNDLLTVFVNCRMTDASGRLMGAAGVGIQMSHLQELLRGYETEYALEAFLMNEDGLVQVDSSDDKIEVEHFFQRPNIAQLREQIINDKTGMQIFWYPTGGMEHCLITQYVENMDWYLVIHKDTTQMQRLFTTEIRQSLLLVVVIIAIVLVLVSCALRKYKRLLLRAAGEDGVTGLPNNKLFMEQFHSNARRGSDRPGKLFILDVDDFKRMNDQYGHMAGNAVLHRVGKTVQDAIGKQNLVSRWGGDEFAGVVYGTPEETKALVTRLVAEIAEIHDQACPHISISLGATELTPQGDLDTMLGQADMALYRAKENGKNQAVMFGK